MSCRSRSLFTCLALLALGWAQVFGLTRGYLCDCGGIVSITLLDHCHGPHGENCHDHDVDHDHGPVHQHDHSAENSDTHEHPPLKESVRAKQLGATSISLTAPTLAVIAVIEILSPSLLARQTAPATTPPPQRADDDPQRWPLLLAHRIALRV